MKDEMTIEYTVEYGTYILHCPEHNAVTQGKDFTQAFRRLLEFIVDRAILEEYYSSRTVERRSPFSSFLEGLMSPFTALVDIVESLVSPPRKHKREIKFFGDRRGWRD